MSRSGSPFQLRFSFITNVEGLDSGRISSLGIGRGGDPRNGRIGQPLQELMSCMTDSQRGAQDGLDSSGRLPVGGDIC